MRRRPFLVASVLLVLVALPVVVAGQPTAPWHDVYRSRHLMRHGVHPITVELHSTGTPACMGRNCRLEVEVRNVQGDLPSQQLRYFYSDSTEREAGCPPRHRDTLFAHWSEAEIGPARLEDRPSCGIGVTLEDGTIEDWVILRTRRLPEPPAAP